MSDDEVRITIVTDKNFVREVKKSLLDHNVDALNEGYLWIMQVGLDHVKKLGVKKNDDKK